MAKFKIGQQVHCFRKHGYAMGFDFIGTILSCANTGSLEEPDWEYAVSNAPELIPGFPILIWEYEMEAMNGQT